MPGLWRLEVPNAFQTAIRRQRIDALYRDASLVELRLMPITIDPDTSPYAWSTTLRLSERFSLTLDDAAIGARPTTELTAGNARPRSTSGSPRT